MRDDAHFPDAIGRFVPTLAREEGESGSRGIFLEVHGLPKLVRSAPAADDQKIELRAAKMQHDKSELAIEMPVAHHRLGLQKIMRELADVSFDWRFGPRDVVPFEARVAERNALTASHKLVVMSICGIDMRQT